MGKCVALWKLMGGSKESFLLLVVKGTYSWLKNSRPVGHSCRISRDSNTCTPWYS